MRVMKFGGAVFAATVHAMIACNSGSTCPRTSSPSIACGTTACTPPQVCCSFGIEGVTDKPTCSGDASACTLSVDTPPQVLACDDSTDCPEGDVCCLFGSKGGEYTACEKASDCVLGGADPYAQGVEQLCMQDCDCPSGSCGDAGSCQ